MHGVNPVRKHASRFAAATMLFTLCFLWYVYVFRTHSPTSGMIAVSILIALTMWSYAACAYTDPGTPKCKAWQEWEQTSGKNGTDAEKAKKPAPKKEEDLSEAEKAERKEEERKQREEQKSWHKPGEVTWCSKCEHFRPERAHHCKRCGVCVLRMDHHCPWVGNCIGFENHKYYILTCWWGFWACAVALTTVRKPDALTALTFFMDTSKAPLGTMPHPDMMAAVAALIAFTLVLFCAFLFITTLLQAQKNLSSVESEYCGDNPYCQPNSNDNIKQLFGPLGIQSLLPVPPKDRETDGTSFPAARQEPTSYGSTD